MSGGGADPSKPWRVAADGLAVAARLTPKSGRDSIDGVAEGADGAHLKARVRAVPEKGAANAALIAVFAKWLDVPKSTVALDAGGKSRLKSLRVSGDGTALAARLAARLAQDGS